MANLEKFNMDAVNETFKSFKLGQMVNSKIVAITADGIILNIGGKKDGLIQYNELEEKALPNPKVGDEFESIIVSTKDDSGMIVVSKAKADAVKSGDAIIGGLKPGDKCNLVITDTNKAGLLSQIGSFKVFIPYSQISAGYIDHDLKNYLNKQVTAVILEIEAEDSNIVASIKATEQEAQFTAQTAFWEAIFENKVVKGRVKRFADFGAFVNVDGVDCLVHNSEVSFNKNQKASDVLELDKEYNFRVIKLDRENKKVSLSYKALLENPQAAKIKAVNVGDIVDGTVQKILPFGAVISFGDGIEGMLHVKEASHYYVKNIYEVAKVGQVLKLKVIDVDPINLKVSLSLKAMQEEPEVLKFKEKNNEEKPKK